MELRRTLTLPGMGLRAAGLAVGLGMALCGLWAAPAAAHPPADDYVPYEPSGFFTFNWSGAYVGGLLGLAHANLWAAERVRDPNDPTLLGALYNEQSTTSITGGVQAGWQRHWGKMVWGVEAGVGLLRFDDVAASPLIPDLTRSVEVTHFLSLTGRLGYTDGRWLAYAKAGIVNAEISIGFHDAFTGASSSSSARETGWTAGVGIDYALTYNLFLGFEYNYLHFNADVSPLVIPDLPTEFDNAELDIQTFVVRLNYRLHPGCCFGIGGL